MPVPNRFPLPLWGDRGAHTGGDGLQGFPFPNPTGPEAARLLDGVNRIGPALEKHGQAVEQLAGALDRAAVAVAREAQAFKAGLGLGFAAALLLCLVTALLLGSGRRNGP